MNGNHSICHGQFDCMHAGSAALSLGPLSEARYRLRNLLHHLAWHLKDKGVLGTMKLVFSKLAKLFGAAGERRRVSIKDKGQYDEVLNLRPGELVEVKGEQEVLTTLDEKGRNVFDGSAGDLVAAGARQRRSPGGLAVRRSVRRRSIAVSACRIA